MPFPVLTRDQLLAHDQLLTHDQLLQSFRSGLASNQRALLNSSGKRNNDGYQKGCHVYLAC